MPKVKYNTSRFSLACLGVCQRINCFSHCKFFNQETTNIYISPQNDRRVYLSSPRSPQGFDDQDHQLTNTTFFVHLYDQFNDHLPYIFSIALKSLPEEIKKFWERWDPNSMEQLEKGKAKRLLKVLSEADDVYTEVRKEIMKKDLLKKMECSQQNFRMSPRMRLETQPPEAKKESMDHQPLERLCLSGNASLDAPSSPSFEKMTSPSFRTQEPALVQALATMEVAPPAEVDIPVSPRPGNLGSSLDPSKKYVVKKGVFTEFSPKKLAEDLVKITKCSSSIAEEIARGIQESMPQNCTSAEIWDQLVDVLKIRNIRIRPITRSRLGEEVEEIFEKMDLAEVDAIPQEDFLNLLEANKKQPISFCGAQPRRKRSLKTDLKIEMTAARPSELPQQDISIFNHPVQITEV